MNSIFDYIKWIWKIDYVTNISGNPLYGDLKLNKTAIVSKGGDMYFGIIENEGVIGPVFTAPPDDETISEIVHLLGVNVGEYKYYGDCLSAAPVISLTEFAKIICMANFTLNVSEIKPEELFSEIIKEEKAEPLVPPARNYQIEQFLLPLIRKGDVQMLKLLLSSVNYKTVFKLGGDNLASMKKIAISLITLASREAIKGGADIEDALSESDRLLVTLDSINSVDGVINLLYQAVITFTRIAGSEENEKQLSLPTLKAVKFINRNINKKIKLCDIAEHTGVTENYISALFRRELGVTISDYVKTQKLNEAKRLLSETDMSLSDIADSLSYSSQSYFQNQFKSAFGITPARFKMQV